MDGTLRINGLLIVKELIKCEDLIDKYRDNVSRKAANDDKVKRKGKGMVLIK